MNNDNHICSFCGTNINNNELMIGIDATICRSCIDIYYHIMELNDEISLTDEVYFDPQITPKKIYEKISKKVIGQEEAKKVLSVALYNHYKKINSHNHTLEKSNILMIGPTGSGKTLLAKTLADILNIPFACVDATVYTEAGYVGEDVESMLLKLLQNADYNKERAQKGIIFIDEIDKVARKTENPSITRDVSGEGVQNSLLKIIEGSIVNIPPQGGRKHPYQEYITFDTTNVLFICAGAFEGINLVKKNTIGLNKTNQIEEQPELYAKLIKAGLIPELLGRLPIVVSLNKLELNDLKDILTKPENAILNQYQELLKMDNIDIEFSQEAIDEIARKALKQNTGARSLRSILEQFMLGVMFEIPQEKNKYKLVITKEMVLGEEKAKIKENTGG
jgi:ATP-dependent Clp protease ATP-binding subunit ClpX